MWTVKAFSADGWLELTPQVVDGAFTSKSILDAANRLGVPPVGPVRHLAAEGENPETSRDAIELWAVKAAAESKEFDWASQFEIGVVEEAIALFEKGDGSTVASQRPTALAWHDHTAVVIALKGDERELLFEYTPSLRDENRVERLRHRYWTADQDVETFFEWRGYFGTNSAVIDGIQRMGRAGKRFIVSLGSRQGIIVGTVVRSLPSPASLFTNDPRAKSRLITMTERHPQIAANFPDLTAVDAATHERAAVFVHGTTSCGILGLNDLFPNAAAPIPTYRFEHDTFLKVADNARELAELVKSRLRVKKLLFVAHSRGGLVGRLAMKQLRHDAYPGEIHLFTFGTPHRGTPLVASAGKALNLIMRLGEGLVGGVLPALSPLMKAYTYLFNFSQLPPGIDIMREGDNNGLANIEYDSADLVRSWGSEYNIDTGSPAYGVLADGFLVGTMGQRPHDLIVPTASALGFGANEAVLGCAHSQYFTDQQVRAAVEGFGEAPVGAQAGAPATSGASVSAASDPIATGQRISVYAKPVLS